MGSTETHLQKRAMSTMTVDIAKEDSIVSEFLRSIGPWHKHVVIGKVSPQWFKTFQKNLHTWVQDATPADWIKLEAQDPFGALKKLSFVHLVDRFFFKD